ncbi:NAD(P)H-hydrate dehydratase [Vibrio cortegadensis]|uniref:Bifunctional NAD(P)H-hydrate repair enzyme n=1 Tax=Vibrio cortegadensis TaxID=1328770 RepID=A0ABV4M477_9VIBR
MKTSLHSQPLYTAKQVREGEVLAAKKNNITMFELMEKAGEAAFQLILSHYPHSKKWLICCGKGNNGGDGYVVARLAKQAGIEVHVWQAGDLSDKLTEDAQQALELWLTIDGAVCHAKDRIPPDCDLIVDALLGTGFKPPLRPNYAELISRINHTHLPIVSIDIPSGLDADTGHVQPHSLEEANRRQEQNGLAIVASHTITFIGIKQGLVTGSARDHTGLLHFSGLGVDESFNQMNVASAVYSCADEIPTLLMPRKRTAHKGLNGKVLLIGGNVGMGGAIRLASEGCIRSGAGLVSVLTHPDNILPILSSRPEIMALSWESDSKVISDKLHWASTYVLGPGLGQDEQAQRWFEYIKQSSAEKVLDADALNLLAVEPNQDPNRIITPHPGEAARLLNCTVADIEINRYQAAQDLQKKYGGVVVLKGAGSIVCDGKTTWVCHAGNPGMASAGMGDVLSGVIGAMLGQNLTLTDAAQIGVFIHSCAADLCAKENGEIGLVASDLFQTLRRVINGPLIQG